MGEDDRPGGASNMQKLDDNYSSCSSNNNNKEKWITSWYRSEAHCGTLPRRPGTAVKPMVGRCRLYKQTSWYRSEAHGGTLPSLQTGVLEPQ
ncbi:hypothetical protein CHS0354_030918 [Potamilus streckersoni]|uniref:Uncharacterized protein n=1 Tax=Potamilus streckersoni TaxID=2493646 RepID=A0AAE0VJD4_9BIVA|nr:hypothetical protein CHS0354_030918 [Potamilus streckersoni]